MSGREQLVVRILLLVARIVASDAPYAADVKHLANHISIYGKDAGPSDG